VDRRRATRIGPPSTRRSCLKDGLGVGRKRYLAALDRARIDMKIEPFAGFIAECVRRSMKQANARA
jgi:hypothetical protein